MILTTSTFTATIPPVPYIQPPPPPTPQILMPDPISYEFQVVEYVEDGQVTKVALQVKRNTHDQYGNIKTAGMWLDVPRVQIKL
jgi:hypothetical protein